ncbi:hypothetical protein C475_08972 [Halosimplex carlsbadense 2-9-1]|uniref:Uncharacterized protein n=1 Tax=Halosimplex carlsbadense 2-9-1 TaxID=797114 RepID=M0CTM2_9EURY|nr:hypothetical protein [Halosimplex carlsbadense]ELZ26546.1 hypothetical protein C475_08972 [Halosimplex carlsbadense 2-9-1]
MTDRTDTDTEDDTDAGCEICGSTEFLTPQSITIAGELTLPVILCCDCADRIEDGEIDTVHDIAEEIVENRTDG